MATRPTDLPAFVPPAWLADNLDQIVVADVRWTLAGGPDRAGYEERHIPGAIFVDLDADLSGAASGDAGRHPLPAPAEFAATLGRLGIGDDDTVVAYDGAAGAAGAARLAWMLRVTGRAAAVLDGGLAAWPGPWASGATSRATTAASTRPWPPDHLASLAEVARVAEEAGVVLLDARSGERHRGELTVADARPGRIPGSVSAPATDLLGPDGALLPVGGLRAQFAAVGATTAGDVIASCGSGVTACLVALAAEHAGLRAPRIYVGSYSGWSSDPDRPVATGP